MAKSSSTQVDLDPRIKQARQAREAVQKRIQQKLKQAGNLPPRR